MADSEKAKAGIAAAAHLANKLEGRRIDTRIGMLINCNPVYFDDKKFDFLDYLVLTNHKNPVRETDPGLADWLNALNKAFNVSAVAVRVGDKIIYRRGTFDPPKQIFKKQVGEYVIGKS